MFAARVELIGAGDDDPNVDDDDGQPATTTEGSVTSIQLTQSNFPIAQPVNGSFPEEEEEEVGEDQLVIEEGGDDILLDGSVNSDDSHVILMRQEVALATTDGGGEGQDVDRRVQIRQLSPGEEDKKARKRRRSIVCGVMGVAVVACVVGAVFAGFNKSRLKNETKGVSEERGEEEEEDLNIDEGNVVEVLLQSFLENIGVEHRIPGTPQYRAIQWLNESAREGSERFNLSEWAIRKLLVQLALGGGIMNEDLCLPKKNANRNAPRRMVMILVSLAMKALENYPPEQ